MTGVVKETLKLVQANEITECWRLAQNSRLFFHAKARKFFKFSTEIKRDGRVFFVSILPKEFQYINRGNNNKKRQKQ